MNTLSSLLKWIGNTIGANPNTLTTSAKTLVGAINEVRSTAQSAATTAKNTSWEIVYPVGSYYETSNTLFNPNTAWGGTWVLELAGMVHVSGGTGYTVSKANNNGGVGAQDGGSPYIQQHQHGNSFALQNTSHTHGTGNGTYDRFMMMTSSGDGVVKRTIKNGTGTSFENILRSEQIVARGTATGGNSATPYISGGVGNVSGATTGSAGNMQPYINVNRWHRTA